MSTTNVQPRLVLAGRYQLERRVAIGGMGEVWAATDGVLHREVAVKVLRADIGDDPAARRRFRVEAQHAAALTHPGVARVYDYGEEELEPPVAYLVMELVDGRPVAGPAAQPLPVDVVVDVLTQAADALGAAHAVGIVHRDVKPGNLLRTPAGGVKVTDFGIARAIGTTATDAGMVAGTAAYMSPEQAMGRSVGASSDVYSLAVVGYQLLTGRVPFVGAPAAVALAHVQSLPPPLPTTVPAELRHVIERSLSKDPLTRPCDGTALAAELRAVHLDGASDVTSAEAPTAVMAPTGPDATQVWPGAPVPSALVAQRRRRRRWVGALAGGALLAALLTAVAAGATDGPTLDGQVPPTTVAVAAVVVPSTEAPTTVAAPTTSPPPAEATPPAGPGKGNNGNGKGKGKDKG